MFSSRQHDQCFEEFYRGNADACPNVCQFHNLLICCDFICRQIYVTTLDGRLSTLDLTKDGSIQWSIPTEPGELLSSSIHRLELTNEGKYVRMIPSLNGGIYKFDGDSLEAIPVTAEDLLKSSFKFTDDMVISGGKEVRRYGVNTRTGHVVYECSMAGCSNKNRTELLDEESESPSDLDDIMVVTRQTQTVRAIEPRTGNERWNFSIGHHELELIQNENCHGAKDDELDKFIMDLDLRVIVPDGIICGYSKTSPNTVLWKQKFDAPIVSVFRMDENNRLYSVDLFKNVQWLWNGQDFFRPSIDAKMNPSVYLGMYQQQLYIQESEFIRSSLEHHNQLEHDLLSDETKSLRIPFQPYPASNTEIVKYITDGDDGEKADGSENEIEKQYSQELIKINAQSVLYSSQYANGKGFYFFTDNETMQCGKKTRSTKISTEDFDNVTFKDHGILTRTSSLWDYWKEIAVIALTTAFVLNMMLNNRRRRETEVVYVTVPFAKDAMEFEEEENQRRIEDDLKNEDQAKIRSASESNSFIGEDGSHYASRFLNDFDMVQCLGKGGFGVVFEVKNKLDDCNYAIKRILLPAKKESRDRVMREVKTLANCEHKNIVRYFHAWVEQPPKGWQEKKDKELLTRDILSTSITIDSPSPTEESKAFVIHDNKRSVSRSATSNRSWLTHLGKESNFDALSKGDFNRNSTIDDSCSFIQFKADSCDLETTRNKDLSDDEDDDESFEIEFKNSTRPSNSEEASEVISIKNESFSHASQNDLKKGHRRQMSLDLPSNSVAKPAKPNVVLNGNTNKMYLYIQMQLCMKNSLKDWLRANDLQLRNGKTFEIWNQIIEAVHYVHLKGLIHRDLKPSNIFFSLDGQIKIGDFGLVTDMAEMPTDLVTSSSSISNSNSSSFGDFDFTNIRQKNHTQRVGTSLYMSPEQSNGLSYNYKVDIYSLGLILFELLNFFNTETERYKVLANLRNHVFPSEFIDSFSDEVSYSVKVLADF